MCRRPRPLLADVGAASAAASAVVVVTNPLEVVKTRLQLAGEGERLSVRAGPFATLLGIWRNEGLRGIQSGLSVGIAYQIVMNGTRLGGFDYVKGLLPIEFGEARSLVAAAFTGACGALASSPFFQIKVRLQSRQESDVTSGFRSVIQNEGYGGLMRGANGAMLRVAVGSSAQLTSYDVVKRRLPLSGFKLHLASSIIASFAVIVVMNPFDVVSTRLYNDKRNHYRGSIFRCFASTLRIEGFSALYKGALAHYLRLGPHTILTFVVWEQCKLGIDAVLLFFSKRQDVRKE